MGVHKYSKELVLVYGIATMGKPAMDIGSSWQGFYTASPSSFFSTDISMLIEGQQVEGQQVGSVEKPVGEEPTGHRFLAWVI